MSQPYDPFDDFGMDDFNIEDFTSRVNFDDEDDLTPEEPQEAPTGDTGEYTPVGREETMHPVRKHHRKKQPTGMRVLRGVLIALIYILVITFAGYLLATFGWRWANDLLALNKQEVTATVTLEDDMFTEKQVTDDEGNTKTVYQADMGQISQLLQDNGLIEYKWLFNLFASFTHKDNSMAPVSYTHLDVYKRQVRSPGGPHPADGGLQGYGGALRPGPAGGDHPAGGVERQDPAAAGSPGPAPPECRRRPESGGSGAQLGPGPASAHRQLAAGHRRPAGV